MLPDKEIQSDKDGKEAIRNFNLSKVNLHCIHTNKIPNILFKFFNIKGKK